jgi:hypothetical protein
MPVDQRAQLTVRIDVVHERAGGCRLVFSASEGSDLAAKYGGKERGLAACRDMVVNDLDFFIREFHDEK